MFPYSLCGDTQVCGNKWQSNLSENSDVNIVFEPNITCNLLTRRATRLPILTCSRKFLRKSLPKTERVRGGGRKSNMCNEKMYATLGFLRCVSGKKLPLTLLLEAKHLDDSPGAGRNHC